MPSIGSSLGVTLPTPGVTADWGDDLNTVLETIIDAIEAGCPASGLVIAANVDMNTYGLTELGFAQLNPQTATLTTASDYHKVYAYAGDLYFTDGTGTAVQMTKNSSINVAAAGAITGSGYGSGGVAVNWDAGGSEFEFLDGTGSDDFANIRIDDLRLHDGSSHYAAITAQAMASDYTLTLPAALPASAQIMTMSNTGAIAASNTISQAVTFSSAVTVSSSIVAPGYKTASASKLVLPALLFDESAESNDWSKNTGSGGYYWTIGNSSDGHTIYCGIPLNVGYQISQIDVYLQTSVARAADANSVLVSFVTHTGAATASVSSAQAANSSALQTVSITGLSTTLAAGTFYGIVVREALLGGGTLDVYGAVVHYNYP